MISLKIKNIYGIFFQKSVKKVNNSYIFSHRNVYILPTVQGIVFFLLLFLMFIGSVNYQLNLGYLLTFWLASVAAVSLLHTYNNMIRLTVNVKSITSVFCGENINIDVSIYNMSNTLRHAITCYIPGKWHHSISEMKNISGHRWQYYCLALPADQRGQHSLDRVVVEAKYPLGLFRAWSPIPIKANYFVYPKPIYSSDLSTALFANSDRETALSSDGTVDFFGFKKYQHGDSLKHVHWKGVAKAQPWVTKQYVDQQDENIWLNWFQFDGENIETRLSYLTAWVMEAENRGYRYGLILPERQIALAKGESHYHRCLKTLALFGKHS